MSELTEKTIRQRTKQLRQINDELQEEISERQKVESLQQALFEISELSASVEGNMDDFYSAIHDILSRLIGAPNCYVAMIDNGKQALQFPYYKDEVQSQIELIRSGMSYSNLVEAAIIGNGILKIDDEQQQEYINLFDNKRNDLSIVKFVPASGAATRMFKFLFQCLGCILQCRKDGMLFNLIRGTDDHTKCDCHCRYKRRWS